MTDTIATFLVERFWPGVTVRSFAEVSRAVDESVGPVRMGGASIGTFTPSLVLADEAAYWVVVDAASIDLVSLVFEGRESRSSGSWRQLIFAGHRPSHRRAISEGAIIEGGSSHDKDF